MSDVAAKRTVHIDLANCQGHGRCMLVAPEIFGYGDVSNQAYLLPDADPEAHSHEVDAAIAGCPETALSWLTESAERASSAGTESR